MYAILLYYSLLFVPSIYVPRKDILNASWCAIKYEYM